MEADGCAQRGGTGCWALLFFVAASFVSEAPHSRETLKACFHVGSVGSVGTWQFLQPEALLTPAQLLSGDLQAGS